MKDVDAILSRNLAEVEQRSAAACQRAGRPREAVTLVAVTKYVDVLVAQRLHALGVSNLGESRPQELWRKAAVLPDAAWHLVGHLQRNKVAKTLPRVQLIHAVDSIRLLEALEAEATRQHRVVDVLLEFNLSGEAAKHGLAVGDAASLLESLPALRSVRVRGLMTMAALDQQPEHARPTFAALRQLADKFGAEVEPPHDFRHLSMGMTNDFEVAIEEGATLVRIGSALFQGLEDVAG